MSKWPLFNSMHCCQHSGSALMSTDLSVGLAAVMAAVTRRFQWENCMLAVFEVVRCRKWDKT